MLSFKQQRFLLYLLYKQNAPNFRKGAETNETNIFDSNISFYSSIRSLIEAGYIEKQKDGFNNRYLLTPEGEYLASSLINLDDDIKEINMLKSLEND